MIVARPRSPRVSLALRKTLFRAQNLFTAASSLLGSTLILVGVNKVGGWCGQRTGPYCSWWRASTEPKSFCPRARMKDSIKSVAEIAPAAPQSAEVRSGT